MLGNVVLITFLELYAGKCCSHNFLKACMLGNVVLKLYAGETDFLTALLKQNVTT